MSFWRSLVNVVCQEMQWIPVSRENGIIRTSKHLSTLTMLNNKCCLKEESAVCVVLWATTDLCGNGSKCCLSGELRSGCLQGNIKSLHISFITSMNYRLPWRWKGSRTKDSRGKSNWSYFQEQKHIIWEEDILYLSLSWSCEDLLLVVSFCFVRLRVTF